MRQGTLLCVLLLLPPCLAGGVGRQQLEELQTQLVAKAQQGDAVALWRAASEGAAAAVVRALREQQHDVELQDVDLEELRIWHGQSVSLGLEADGQPYRFVVQSEPEWRSLKEVLPAAQGGLLPASDWDSLHRDWLSPVSRGSLLLDFALQGPVDVHLAQPTALQLFLPHASDAGTVHRVLLRSGAAVMVRGARTVRLRRGLDLPPISLSEFAGIVTSDAAQQQPLGIMHLLAGVQAAAAQHWNESHPDTSLGLVALQLEFSPRGAALLAAPGPGSSSRRLKARSVKPGVIELLPRDVPAAPAGTHEGAVALQSSGGAASEGAWPLSSVSSAQLQSYERLLRQIISSRLFQAGPPAGKGKGSGSRGGRHAAAPAGRPAVRIAKDVQLRLTETEAEATTLLQMQLELLRRPLIPGEGSGKGKQQQGGSKGGKGAAGGRVSASSSEGAAGGKAVAVMDEAPDAMQIMARAATRLGPHETWTATVQVRGDAQRGTLKFVPLLVQRVGAAHDTVELGPGGLQSLLSAQFPGNASEVAFE